MLLLTFLFLQMDLLVCLVFLRLGLRLQGCNSLCHETSELGLRRRAVQNIIHADTGPRYRRVLSTIFAECRISMLEITTMTWGSIPHDSAYDRLG